MKLAEALQERADLSTRIDQLRARLSANATVQEGEKPSEDPMALLKELDECLKTQEKLIADINLTNSKTKVEGKTLLLAQRDSLTLKIACYRSLLNDASLLAQRATRTEIKIMSAVNVPDLQKQVDKMSKELRKVDNIIQETNWNTML